MLFHSRLIVIDWYFPATPHGLDLCPLNQTQLSSLHNVERVTCVAVAGKTHFFLFTITQISTVYKPIYRVKTSVYSYLITKCMFL